MRTNGRTDGRMDEQTDMTNLTVAFRNFLDAQKTTNSRRMRRTKEKVKYDSAKATGDKIRRMRLAH
jgi:hypothetical protein